MSALHAQLRTLVTDHGLISTLKALAEVCDTMASRAIHNQTSWRMGRRVILIGVERLNQLLEVPGITEPLNSRTRAAEKPVDEPAGPEWAQGSPSSPGAPAKS